MTEETRESLSNEETKKVREHLKRLVMEGIDSGPSIDGEFVCSRLREKYSKMSQKDLES